MINAQPIYQSLKSRKALFGIAGFMAVSFIFVVAIYLSSSLFNHKKEPSTLSGLKPGTIISATLIREDVEKNVSVILKPDETGMISLPNFETNDTLAYNLEIRDEKDRFNILLRNHQDRNSVSVFAQGLEPFAKITPYSEENKEWLDQKWHGDWAGIFENNDIANPSASDSIKLSFSGTGMGFIDDQDSPLKLSINLSAPGGGTGTGVNEYTTSPCGDPDHDLSMCNNERLDASIENILNNLVRAMMQQTNEIVSAMFSQTMQMGAMMDAKRQMEIQRKMDELKARARKDYQTSEQVCEIGTFSRSLATSDLYKVYNHISFNEIFMERALNLANSSSDQGYDYDLQDRLSQFKTDFCERDDNDGSIDLICGDDSASPRYRSNKDINIMETLYYPLTIDANFADENITTDEEDIIALTKNIYWHQVFDPFTKDLVDDHYEQYMSVRQMIAMHNVAHNSIATLVGMKSQPEDVSGLTAPFMHSLLTDMGFPNPEDIIGENPSYYAQMDMLTKKMVQNPNFYTNLFDTPTNLDRIKVSLQAIKMMNQRDRLENMYRREMLASMLVETELIRAQADEDSEIAGNISEGE